jgi:hypothetical protein
VVSFDRFLLKGEAPRLSADFNHRLSYERPFKFPHHLVGPLEINNIIAISAINIHSAIFKLKQHGNRHGNRNGHGNGNGYGNGNGNGNWQYMDMDMAMDTDMDMELVNIC